MASTPPSTYDSLRIAFAGYLTGFFNSLVPDTSGLTEFAARPISKALVWAPGRMVDDANAMIAAWRRNDTAQASQTTPFLPVIMVAMARDYTSSPPDWASRQLGDVQFVEIPGDPLNRVLRLRAVQRELRAQVVIFAQETQTANSLALQLHMWCAAFVNRRFSATYTLAGVPLPWPVLIETSDIIAPSQSLDEEKNLTILAFDIMLRPTIPIVTGPKGGEPNDGQGAGTVADPHGEPLVVSAEILPQDGSREVYVVTSDSITKLDDNFNVDVISIANGSGALLSGTFTGSIG